MLASLPDGALECVLLGLHLKDLASLSASCKATRAAVGQLPEAVWKTIASQDSGERCGPLSVLSL